MPLEKTDGPKTKDAIVFATRSEVQGISHPPCFAVARNDPPEFVVEKCPPMFCCVIVSPKPPKQFAGCLPHLVPWHVAMAVRSDVFYPRRGVRGNGQIAMVGRGWKRKKKEGGG